MTPSRPIPGLAALWLCGEKAEVQTGPSGQVGLQAAKGAFPRDLQPHPCSLLGTTGVSTALKLEDPVCLGTQHCSVEFADQS